MCKKTKIWLILAALLVVIGLIMFAAVMTAYNWDFTKLSTVKYETNAYEVSGEFRNIIITSDTADIAFVTSEDKKCKVVCYEPENAKHSVVVEDGMLTIAEINGRKWYDYIGISIGTPKITVYLPDAAYDELTIKEHTGDVEIPADFRFEGIDVSTSTGDVKNYASASSSIRIKTSTGDIHVENSTTDTFDLSVSTGSITVSNVTCVGDTKINVSTGKTNITNTKCKNMMSSGKTGGISLKNVIAAEKLSIERSTGYVRFDSCDATDIFVEISTGDVTGTFLSEKIFIVETGTGSIDVPKSITGGRCEITTSTGDIRLDIR